MRDFVWNNISVSLHNFSQLFQILLCNSNLMRSVGLGHLRVTVSRLPGHKEVSKTSCGSTKQLSPVHNCLSFCNCASSDSKRSGPLSNCTSQLYSTLWMLNQGSMKHVTAYNHKLKYYIDLMRPPLQWMSVDPLCGRFNSFAHGPKHSGA